MSSHLNWCTIVAIRSSSSPKSCNHTLHLVQHSEGSTPRDQPCLVVLPHVKTRDSQMKQLLDPPFASQKSPARQQCCGVATAMLVVTLCFQVMSKIQAGKQAGGQTHQSVVTCVCPYQECADLWDFYSRPPASSSGMCKSRNSYHIPESTLFFTLQMSISSM